MWVRGVVRADPIQAVQFAFLKLDFKIFLQRSHLR